jgi:hypothetical protein
LLRNRIILSLAFFMPCLSSIGNGQQLWSGIVDPTRAINWTLAGSPSIPNRTTICATLNAGASLASVNTAIANCPSGEVVYLSAGNYSFGGQIFFNNTSNVTLRGAGPDQTFVSFTKQGSCNGLQADVCIANGDIGDFSGGPSNVATWTAGYAPGTNTITVGKVTTGSISNLFVGSLIILDQLDDAADTGNIYMCGSSGSAGDCSQQGTVGGRPGRGQDQQVTVTSISGTGPWTIGITPGLYAPNWRTSQSPNIWWSSALPVTGVGIENISLNHSGSNGSGVYGMGIQFVNATNSWVNNVRSLNDLNGVSEHVEFFQSSHITVENSYFYGSNPASEGYGPSCDFSSSDNLVINNVVNHVASPFVTQSCVGSVFAYNYAVDNYFGGNWQQSDVRHSTGDEFNLYEGNQEDGFTADDIHGTSAMLTFFREYLDGRDTATETGAKTSNTESFNIMSFDRYYNIIGSVLGTAGYHTIYTTQAASATDCGNSDNASLSVFLLGYSDQNGVYYGSCNGFSPAIPNDLLVASTLMRWGNYTACTATASCNAVRFVSSEVPSGLSLYANAVPASQSLPPSFFLALKPSWWSASIPWPAVGPDVSSGNVANVAGHVYLNPAANCYLNVMGGTITGSSGALTFNAKNCYSLGGPTVAAGLTGVAVPAP